MLVYAIELGDGLYEVDGFVGTQITEPCDTCGADWEPVDFANPRGIIVTRDSQMAQCLGCGRGYPITHVARPEAVGL